MTTEIMSERQIYVASLADYNAGRLHGVWIDATPVARGHSEAHQNDAR